MQRFMKCNKNIVHAFWDCLPLFKWGVAAGKDHRHHHLLSLVVCHILECPGGSWCQQSLASSVAWIDMWLPPPPLASPACFQAVVSTLSCIQVRVCPGQAGCLPWKEGACPFSGPPGAGGGCDRDIFRSSLLEECSGSCFAVILVYSVLAAPQGTCLHPDPSLL